MQQPPKMTAPEDKTLSTRIRHHVKRLKAVSLLINRTGKRGERTQKKNVSWFTQIVMYVRNTILCATRHYCKPAFTSCNSILFKPETRSNSLNEILSSEGSVIFIFYFFDRTYNPALGKLIPNEAGNVNESCLIVSLFWVTFSFSSGGNTRNLSH